MSEDIENTQNCNQEYGGYEDIPQPQFKSSIPGSHHGPGYFFRKKTKKS